jgi:hypothetical protein
MGIKLHSLRKLKEDISVLCTDGLFTGVKTIDDLTTTQLVKDWVVPSSRIGHKRLAELLDPADIGVPTYFVSHAWKSTVGYLINTIERFLASASDSTCVWIDFLAINQHSAGNPEQNKADVAAFEDVLKICEGGTLVVIDMEKCNTASRAWCLFEWDHTLHLHGQDGLHMHGEHACTYYIMKTC